MPSVNLSSHHSPANRTVNQAKAHEINQLGVAEAAAILAKGEAEAKVRSSRCLCLSYPLHSQVHRRACQSDGKSVAGRMVSPNGLVSLLVASRSVF